ncbi:MAG: V-type ATPase 116kDa subunit family protein [Candidatus Woesearchaeota archaeon]
MIKPKPMYRVTILAPKLYMKEIIESMYNLNVVHIEEHTKNEVFDIGKPLENNEKNAEILVKLRSLISNLKITGSINPSKKSFDTISDETNKLYDEYVRLINKKEYYQGLKKIYTKNKKKGFSKILNNFKFEQENGFSNENYIHYIGFINSQAEKFKEKLDIEIKKYFLFNTNYENLNLIALFIEKNKKEKTEILLENFDFSPIEQPHIKVAFPKLKSKSGIKFVKLNYQLEKINAKLKEVDSEIQQFKIKNTEFLLSAEKALRIESEKAEVPLKFGETKNTFLVKGYVPVENKEKLEKKLLEITKGSIMIKFEKPNKSENVPTAYNHPKIVEPFEAFMDLYTIPKYKEIDPTFFMFLTFPIFFGFMLGDVGYGLVTLTLFLFLRAKMPGAKNLLNAFIIASISSIFFGIIFGEYFGFEELPHSLGESLQHSLPKSFIDTWHMKPIEKGHGSKELIYPTPHLFSRSHGITELLSMAVLFGIVHILIGFIIGFINIYNAHGLKHAIFEKGGWILILPMIVWILMEPLGIIKGFVYDMLKIIIPPFTILIGLFILGAILTIIGEGVQGAIEVLFLSLMSNILSYARLMAVGLASLSLAVVVNDLATEMFRSGIVGILMGIIILLLGHGINIALGILSPFLHSLRLHYVEFFGKFFKGGGKKFKPFGLKD